ncbi:MAG: hypothetical protein P8P29_06815 [Flavobacteriaceae bacterium]|nr:hypothetical protein [Flavobacteriaceae bacterium]
MSYRNPQIIQDRSGEILAKGIESFGASIAQGLTKKFDQERRDREKRKLEDKQYSKDVTKLANEMAKNKALFHKGIQEAGESMRAGALDAVDPTLQRIFEIKKLQLNGNSDPALSNELAQLDMKITGFNSMIKAGIAVTGELTEDVANYEECGKTLFLHNGPGDSEEEIAAGKKESKTFYFAFGGVEGYEKGFREENGDMVAYAKKTGEGEEEYVIPRSEFKDRMESLTKQMDNLETNSSERIAAGFFTKEGKGSELISTIEHENKIKIETNEAGELRRYERQYFDTAFVEGEKKKSFDAIEADIDSVNGDEQHQQYYLDALQIDYNSKGWKELDDTEEGRAEKGRILNDVNETMFNNRLKMKQDSEGRYYRQISDKPAKDPNKGSSSGEPKFGSQADEKIAREKLDKLKEDAKISNVEDLLGLTSNMTGKNTSHVLQYTPAAPGSTVITLQEVNKKDGNASEEANEYDLTNVANVMGLLRKMGAIEGKRVSDLRELADVIVEKYKKDSEVPPAPFIPYTN